MAAIRQIAWPNLRYARCGTPMVASGNHLCACVSYRHINAGRSRGPGIVLHGIRFSDMVCSLGRALSTICDSPKGIQYATTQHPKAGKGIPQCHRAAMQCTLSMKITSAAIHETVSAAAAFFGPRFTYESHPRLKAVNQRERTAVSSPKRFQISAPCNDWVGHQFQHALAFTWTESRPRDSLSMCSAIPSQRI